jgi:gliding motility-associated-like protein
MLSLVCIAVSGQVNLVFNGDFEDYSACPNGYSNPSQTPYEITKCIGWNAPTYGTSDFFHSCAPNANVQTPYNGMGNQAPKSGNGYLGALFCSLTGGTGTDGYNGVMWWEYIQGQFIQPLQAGQIYQIRFYVSLAEASDLAIKEIGAFISENPISSLNTANLQVTPQIIYNNGNYVLDTIDWVLISGYYLSTGNEKYITIGNFNNNDDTDTIRRYSFPNGGDYFFSYYYVDGVETYDVTDEFNFSNIITPNNDGFNDTWIVPPVTKGQLIIYNRWGKEILKTDLSEQFKWDGLCDLDTPCSDGAYYYIIHSPLNISIKGVLYLIR